MAQKRAEQLAQLTAPAIGSPEYIAQMSSKITTEMDAAKRYILAPAAIAEGVALGAAIVAPEAAVAMRQAVITVASHPETAVDFVRGLTAGKTRLPPMSPAGMIGWAVGNALSSRIP